MAEHDPLSPVAVLQSAVQDFAGVAEQRSEAFELCLLPVNVDHSSIRFQPGAPPYLRELASYAGGYELGSETVMWDPTSTGGLSLPVAMDDPWVIQVDDGGSFSAIDISPEGVWGAVYRFVHDPDLLAYESPSLGEWLATRLNLHLSLTPLTRSDDAAEVYDTELYELLDCPPGVAGACDLSLGRAGDIRTSDPVLQDFCATLPPDAVVSDFRDARRGDYTDLLLPFFDDDDWARAGSLPLFAILPGTAPAVPPGLPGLPPLPPRTFGRRRE
ncbi:SMI1/KNR4 family protein [uncultured Arthrobacter sp.]|uniref:SMI1/KNR4 family protein n=1 Tax=uncultured Arthrobacter sp. TaxID=114050 RepID=UPI0025D87CDA|nr:SMI1/KNR4 family protein [uncultured Arthrobacter sp.]